MRVVVLLLSLSGCGLLGEGLLTRHCDLRESSEGNGECQEYGLFGPDLLPLQGACEAVGGAWGDGECPRDGIMGGCENVEADNPWNVVSWYYEADGYDSPEAVREQCEDGAEVYVDPPA